jgi:hypothetical protein
MSQPKDPPQWCQKMRWKGYHEDQTDPARVLEVFEGGLAIFTCLTTAQPFGVDDGPAAPGRCGPHRDCYVAHRNLRLPLLS